MRASLGTMQTPLSHGRIPLTNGGLMVNKFWQSRVDGMFLSSDRPSVTCHGAAQAGPLPSCRGHISPVI